MHTNFEVFVASWPTQNLKFAPIVCTLLIICAGDKHNRKLKFWSGDIWKRRRRSVPKPKKNVGPVHCTHEKS